MGVAGEGEIDTDVAGTIEGVGVVSQEDIEARGADEVFDGFEMALHFVRAAHAGDAPLQADDAEGGVADDGGCGFVQKEADTGGAHSIFEGKTILEEVVIAFAGVHAAGCAEGAHDIDGIGKVFEREVDEVAGDEDEIRVEVVGALDDCFEDVAAGEGADVGVGDVGDDSAIERGGKIAEGKFDGSDAELILFDGRFDHAAGVDAKGRERDGSAEELAA